MHILTVGLVIQGGVYYTLMRDVDKETTVGPVRPPASPGVVPGEVGGCVNHQGQKGPEELGFTK